VFRQRKRVHRERSAIAHEPTTSVVDGGQTVRLGEFEAAADAILYAFDAEARRRAKQRSIEKDASFGGALRRLRLQRGLRREDFEGSARRRSRASSGVKWRSRMRRRSRSSRRGWG
jgi:hypothetical protein